MDRETALRRLRACMKLAASGNPNEAATALRHAQALMAEHGLSAADAEDNAIGESTARTRGRGGDPPAHVWQLATVIARAFRCYVYASLDIDRTDMRFVGRDGAPEVAAYAYDVLRRQLQAAVARRVARCRKRRSKRERGEQYGLGWVFAVQQKLNVQDLPAPEETAFKGFLAQRGARIQSTDPVPRPMSARDRLAGLMDGSKAQLHPGVHGATTRCLEHIA